METLRSALPHHSARRFIRRNARWLLRPTRADSDIRPILHLLGPKAETLIAVRGQFALVTFDVSGQS
jgi:hypothetical protein